MLQVMPQLLTYLDVDSVGDSIDWGTLCVYTCRDSCDIQNTYSKEFVWKQDFSNSSAIWTCGTITTVGSGLNQYTACNMGLLMWYIYILFSFQRWDKESILTVFMQFKPWSKRHKAIEPAVSYQHLGKICLFYIGVCVFDRVFIG